MDNRRVGFGMAHIKTEGKPLHPDDIFCNMTDEQYNRQLEAYNETFGIKAHYVPEGQKHCLCDRGPGYRVGGCYTSKKEFINCPDCIEKMRETGIIEQVGEGI